MATARRGPGRPTLWLEIEDLLRYFDGAAHPTGIQRVHVEMLAAALRDHPDRTRLCRLSSITGHIEMLDPRILADALSPARGAALRRGLRHAGRFLHAAAGDLIGGRARARRFVRHVAPGDMLVSLGSSMTNMRYRTALARARRAHGIGFAVLVHDILPVTQPRYFGARHRALFGRWLDRMLEQSDLILTSSDHVRDEIARAARAQGRALPATARLRFGASLLPADAGGAGLALPGRFVLYVATIEARKNHRLLVRVWRRLIERHGANAVPTLVFVGAPGWLVAELMAELAASRWLDGKIIHLRGLPDAALSAAYARCLFTVYPSLHEGWGLPIAESLAHGKPCLVSGRSPMTEAGGDFADYFDPENEDDAFAAIERALFQPGYLEKRARHIAEHYRAPGWADCVDGLFDAVDAFATVAAGNREGRSA